MIKLTPIIPKGLAAQFKAVPGAVQHAMDDAAAAVKQDFEKTTSTWEHKPEFTVEQRGADRIVATDDEVWHFVDEGTRPHLIVARRARKLRFAVGGHPKTTPNRITAGAGAPGDTVVFKRAVNHPGTKARLFSQQIAKRWRRGVAPYIRQALEETLH